MSHTRRHFLRAVSGLTAATLGATGARAAAPLATGLAGLAALAAQKPAVAADSGDYKALVCLFLQGGNDSHNWVVPMDASGHAEYAKARGELALPLAALQPIATGPASGDGRRLGLASPLAPLQGLYERGQAAIVANVGPLVRPLTRAEFLAGRDLPPRLFSHNDQASSWQSLGPEGARSGWGGRLADVLMAGNAQPVFTAVSTAGNAVFLAGARVQPYRLSPDGPPGFRALQSDAPLRGAPSAAAALRHALTDPGVHPLQREYARLVQRAIDSEAVLRAGLEQTEVAPLPADPVALPNGGALHLADDPLARQLRMVARLIAARRTLGLRRQVFMVSLDGFDTHAHQMRDHPVLSARVAHAVAWFHATVAALGEGPRVTLFTASEFGRTLVGNGSGSDHGWGAHHFVVGGAVRGGELYGRFPVTALGGPDDAGSGRLLPTTSTAQLAATLGRWMGLAESDLADVLPGIGEFPSAGMAFL